MQPFIGAEAVGDFGPRDGGERGEVGEADAGFEAARDDDLFVPGDGLFRDGDGAFEAEDGGLQDDDVVEGIPGVVPGGILRKFRDGFVDGEAEAFPRHRQRFVGGLLEELQGAAGGVAQFEDEASEFEAAPLAIGVDADLREVRRLGHEVVHAPRLLFGRRSSKRLDLDGPADHPSAGRGGILREQGRESDGRGKLLDAEGRRVEAGEAEGPGDELEDGRLDSEARRGRQVADAASCQKRPERSVEGRDAVRNVDAPQSVGRTFEFLDDALDGLAVDPGAGARLADASQRAVEGI
mmetsp:Transcript_30390/g.97966  ORF Transcript_30390/g.97966 Transcript_30390/m.97966 type:complete len:295 (+) Transcript_30390:224-1108(+)